MGNGGQACGLERTGCIRSVFFLVFVFFLPHDMYCVALRCIAFGLGLGLGFWHGTAGQGIARAACGGEYGIPFLETGIAGRAVRGHTTQHSMLEIE